jgi:hypothetical protein
VTIDLIHGPQSLTPRRRSGRLKAKALCNLNMQTEFGTILETNPNPNIVLRRTDRIKGIVVKRQLHPLLTVNLAHVGGPATQIFVWQMNGHVDAVVKILMQLMCTCFVFPKRAP